MPSSSKKTYPVFLTLEGVPVLVVGGGPVAARKARELVACGADVTVVAKSFSTPLARSRNVKRIRRGFRPGDLREQRLVFAATDDPALNTTIAALASNQGTWVNVAKPPEAGNLTVPSSIRRGPLCLAISTGGSSAAAAKSIRKELEKHFDVAWGKYLRLLGSRRDRIRNRVPNPAKRRRLLQQLGQLKWLELVRKKGARVAGRQMDELIDQVAGGGS